MNGKEFFVSRNGFEVVKERDCKLKIAADVARVTGAGQKLLANYAIESSLN
jgi:hypothetical protein